MTTNENQTETSHEMLIRIGCDAAKWATEFRATALRLGYSDMDEGWLIGWFANAIEQAAHSHPDVVRLRDAATRLRAGEGVRLPLDGLIRPLDGYDQNQPGYQHRKGWNDAIMHCMDLQRALTAEPRATPQADEVTERGPLSEVVDRLRRRYTADPVPSCPVCGGELSIQSAGGGQATVYGCSAMPFDMDHYQRSRYTQYRSGDSDVLALLAAMQAKIDLETGAAEIGKEGV